MLLPGQVPAQLPVWRVDRLPCVAMAVPQGKREPGQREREQDVPDAEHHGETGNLATLFAVNRELTCGRSTGTRALIDTDSEDANEKAMVLALRRGETAAFAALQSRYLDRVFSYVRRRVSQREDAEDITFEVFASAARAASSFRGDSGLFVWLVGIARRKVADHHRRSRHPVAVRECELGPVEQATLAGIEPIDLPLAERLRRHDLAVAVRQAVELLPASQREALLLRYVEQLSVRDVARLLSRSEDSVKALLRRARATLLGSLAPRLGIPGSCSRKGNPDEKATPIVSRTPVPPSTGQR